MNFIKYNSISNVTNKELMHFKNSNLYNPGDIWYCTEKVHGSNFSIMGNGDHALIPAKRTSTLNMEDSNFYNFQRIFDKYDMTNLIRKIVFFATLHDPEYNHGVSVHGELCGGFYPNMDQIPGTKQVQREVKYSNDTEFIVFDIRIYNSESRYKYLNHKDVVTLCQDLNIPVVPIVFEGTLDECLAWSAEHNADPSEVWKIFGMEQEVPNNIREGHVIKPAKSLFNRDERIIFKDKNGRFRETRGSKEPRVKTDKPAYSIAMNTVFNDISAMICAPRFNNVASKYGEYSIKNFADLMHLMVEDIFEELKNDANMSTLTAVEHAAIKSDTLKRVSAFMGSNKKELF